MSDKDVHDDDLQLESALRGYLTRELDGQLGRAEAAFLQRLSDRLPAAAAGPLPLRGRGGFWWAPLAGGIAAAMLVVWGVTAFHHKPHTNQQFTGGGKPIASTQPAADSEQYSDTVDVRTVDEGIVVLDNQAPARQIRREVVEHVEWFDPAANKRIRIDIPSEEVVLVGMNAY